MRPKATRLRPTISDLFNGMRNIGPAARAYLAALGIDNIEALAASDPDQLYLLLQVKTARKHDPCVWDVFAAATHQDRTGESRAWWTFTQERKVRQAHLPFQFGRPDKAGGNSGAAGCHPFLFSRRSAFN